MPESPRHPLLRVPPDKYGDHYAHHLLEQYKLYVESAHAVSERRTSANNYLLTVNAFLVTLYGLASPVTPGYAWRFAIPVAGLLVSASWFVLVRSYRSLNTGKFTVIHELEQYLPAALFDHEWTVIDRGRGKAYKPLTNVEQWIPAVFGALYFLLLLSAINCPR